MSIGEKQTWEQEHAIEKCRPEEFTFWYWRIMAYESRLNTTEILGTSNSEFKIRVLDCAEQVPVYFMV